MSQIFDALQRSEAERNGKDAGAVVCATDLLERTERLAFVKDAAIQRRDAADAATPVVPVIAVAESQNECVAGGISDRLTTARVQPVDEHASGPVQCGVLNISRPAESRLVCLPGNESPASEAFHLLGVRLRLMRRQRTLKKVLITSTIPQEGKSMVAANLACTLARRTQQKVLLLEGDVRRPTQARIFGISSMPGICECLRGERSLPDSIYRLEGTGIWIVPAGTVTGNSLEMLQSGRVGSMMEQLTNWFDWIVIDSPPILPLADTSVWINVADGCLLVTRQGTSQKRQLQRGLEALGTQKLIGAILNSAKTLAHTDYYYRPSHQLPDADAAN